MSLLGGSLGVLSPQVVDIDDEAVGVGSYELPHLFLVHPLVTLQRWEGGIVEPRKKDLVEPEFVATLRQEHSPRRLESPDILSETHAALAQRPSLAQPLLISIPR